MNYGVGYNYSWWYPVIYLIFSYGLNILFQQNFRIRFNRIPSAGFYSNLNLVLFYLLLILSLFVKLESNLYVVFGSGVYLVGLSIYISAMYNFAIAEHNKPVTKGAYRLSRHPVYLGFFIMFFGVFISTLNLFILAFNISIAIISYRIAVKEEEECLKAYTFEYSDYKKRVKGRIIPGLPI